MIDLIKKVNDAAPYLVEEDLDNWVVPDLLEFYSDKINSLAYRAYGTNGSALSPIAKRAFVERAKSEIRAGLYTFVFKSEHWKHGRDVNTYVLTCLNRLADRIRWDYDTVKKVNKPICPGCKYLGRREFLVQESKSWACQSCMDELTRLENELVAKKRNIDSKTIISYESKIKMHRIFAVHSRTGYRCPDCSKFIPESACGAYGISCPYDDCMFFGSLDKLEKMAHPVGLSQQVDVSLQAPAGRSDDTRSSFQDFIIADNNADPEIEIEVCQNFVRDLDIVTNVINDQVESIKRVNSAGTMMQKILMYEAYQRMLKKYPEDMVSYLVHRKQSADFPIQARIFQEYASLMENALPYTIKRNNDIYDVVSLTDPNIQLFSGISEFDATVRWDRTVPNNTVETYTGGRKFKCYGPCFIGMLINVVDKSNNKSIMNMVDNYSFVQIKMKEGIEVGTHVSVKHFRITPHYEMGGLVYLQRIRKKVVDSVYFKLNGKKRIAGNNED
jgi:hypothetical protein